MLVRLIWFPEVTSNTSFIRTLLYVIFLKFLIHENVHFLFKLLLRAIWLPNPEDHISSLSSGIVRSGKSSGLDDQKAIVELIRFGMANLNNKHELVRDVRRTPKAPFFEFSLFYKPAPPTEQDDLYHSSSHHWRHLQARHQYYSLKNDLFGYNVSFCSELVSETLRKMISRLPTRLGPKRLMYERSFDQNSKWPLVNDIISIRMSWWVHIGDLSAWLMLNK